MFAQAVKKVRQFTRPVVVAFMTGEGKLQVVTGTFVVVNSDGWVLTANHIAQWYPKLEQGKKNLSDYENAVQAIQNNKGLMPYQKPKEIKKLGGIPQDSCRDFSVWWGQDGCRMTEAHTVADADLALCKLENFNSAGIAAYPTFKDPSDGIDPGTSICRMGFPFMEMKITYANGTFTVDATNLAFFPNEGIYTRDVSKGSEKLIETSSPGLMGQSGGPLFDRNGTVWGIQSETGHLALGFSPPVPNGKPGEVEHQFLNVGRGCHPATLSALLNRVGIPFSVL